MTEAVRSGTILAHDRNAYQRWRSKTRAAGAAVADSHSIKMELEAMIGGLALTHPEYIAVGPRKEATA